MRSAQESCPLLQHCMRFRYSPHLLTASRAAYITKSIPPSSSLHLLTACSKLSIFLTSTAPMPKTREPALAVEISRAIFSVFSTFRPTMQAFAPRWTSARTWALQMVPAPPVQKTTFLSGVYLMRSMNDRNLKAFTEDAIFPYVAHKVAFRKGHDGC